MKAFQTILLSLLASNVNAFAPTTSSSLKIPSSKLFSTTEEVTTSATATVTAPPDTTTRNEITNNQPKYGNELALPETYVRCGRCATSFALTVDDLGGGKGR